MTEKEVSKIFSQSASDIPEEKRVNLKSLIVPYLDVREGEESDKSSWKWKILGTYSAKDTESLKDILVDYQTNVGPLNLDTLKELGARAYEKGINLELISSTDHKNALSDLATWNGEVDNDLEALEWLIKHKYNTRQFEKEKDELCKTIIERHTIQGEELPEFKSNHSGVKWLLKNGFTLREDKSSISNVVQFDKPSWDDEFWKDENIVTKMRSAAVQKFNNMNGYSKDMKKELISDAPIAASAAYCMWQAIVNSQASLLNTPAMVLTVLGVTIAGVIKKGGNESDKELDEILEALGNFYNNKETKKLSKDEALSDLRKDATRLNIKLSNVKAVTTEEYQKVFPDLMKIAREKGFVTDKVLTAARAEEVGARIAGTQNTSNIASRFASSLKTGSKNTWDAFAESIKEWKHPVALAHGTMLGFKAVGLNAWESRPRSVSKKTHEKSITAIKKAEKAEQKVAQVHQESGVDFPVAEILQASVNLDELEASKATHKNIEEYKKRQKWNHGNFGLAGSLVGYAGYDLIANSAELASSAMQVVQQHAHDPQMLYMGQEMMQALVTKDPSNLISVLANSWGILAGGIAALSATGKKLHDDTMALRSEFTKLDVNLSSVLKLETEIVQIYEQQKEGLKLDSQDPAGPS